MKRFLILCLVLLCVVPLTSAMKLTPTTYGWENGCGAGIYQNVSRTLDGSTDTFTTPTDALQCMAYYDFGQVVTMQDISAYHGRWLWDTRPLQYSNTSAGTVKWTGTTSADSWGRLNSTTNLTSFGNRGYLFFTDGGQFNLSEIEFYGYPGTTPPPPTANFTASPLNATAPAYVAFTDLSENESGTCTYNWSFTPSDGIVGAPGFLEQESPTAYFTEVGDYTVSHGVSCDAGSNISTKTDYIHIVNSSGVITTCFAAIDALSGYQLSGANFQMYDIENTSWTNKTASSTGSECITTLSGHTINAYTDMLGYDDGELLASAARASPDYPILMFPANATNVSAGNVTLYVTVRDMYSPGLPISGAQVDMTYNFPATEQQFTGVSGMVSFVVPNQTTIYLAAQKSGYSGKSTTVESGNGDGGDSSISTTIYLPLKTVTPAPTATTLPGGGTPTPQVTYLPHCDPSAADYDEALCRASKGGVGLNLLADYMDDLILLCIFVTIMYLLGFKLGG